jgi:hypothetical protein
MTIGNPPKALILLVALLSLVLLMAIGRVATEAGMPILTAIVFYGIGNGVGAKLGQQSPKIFEQKQTDDIN